MFTKKCLLIACVVGGFFLHIGILDLDFRSRPVKLLINFKKELYFFYKKEKETRKSCSTIIAFFASYLSYRI